VEPTEDFTDEARIYLGAISDVHEVKSPRSLLWIAVAALAIAVVAVMTTAVVVAKLPQPASAAPTPVVTRTVTLTAQGTAIYYDVSGPGINLSGSTLPGSLVVPVGTKVHLVALVDTTDAESICTIQIDGVVNAAENGYGLDAKSECDAVVR
jgi:hypothetical protein